MVVWRRWEELIGVGEDLRETVREGAGAVEGEGEGRRPALRLTGLSPVPASPKSCLTGSPTTSEPDSSDLSTTFSFGVLLRSLMGAGVLRTAFIS